MNLKQLEDDLMIIINQDSPELDLLYRKLVLNDYSKDFELQTEVEFTTEPLTSFKEGPVEFFSDGTDPDYPEVIQPIGLRMKASIVTDEVIRTESSEELNFKKIFEQCNVEWLKNLQKEINKNFKFIEKVQKKRRKPRRKCKSIEQVVLKHETKRLGKR